MPTVVHGDGGAAVVTGATVVHGLGGAVVGAGVVGAGVVGAAVVVGQGVVVVTVVVGQGVVVVTSIQHCLIEHPVPVAQTIFSGIPLELNGVGQVKVLQVYGRVVGI